MQDYQYGVKDSIRQVPEIYRKTHSAKFTYKKETNHKNLFYIIQLI